MRSADAHTKPAVNRYRQRGPGRTIQLRDQRVPRWRHRKEPGRGACPPWEVDKASGTRSMASRTWPQGSEENLCAACCDLMARIVSLPDGVEFDADEGETLLDAALRAELPLTHACGGRAKCSTCRVWVLAGLDGCSSRTEAEQALAKRLRLGDEVRLACQLRPGGDLRVRRLVLDETDLMMSNQLDRSVANRVGEVREVTVFFSDIVGFTTIAETLPPYDVMHLLNRYFVQAGEIIECNGGYIDKFLGDGMMALFGVDGQKDAPIRAVNAALQTLAAIDRMKPFVRC
jgi:ferredoxin